MSDIRKRPAKLGPGPAQGHIPPRTDHPTADGRPRSLRKRAARLAGRQRAYDSIPSAMRRGYYRPGSEK